VEFRGLRGRFANGSALCGSWTAESGRRPGASDKEAIPLRLILRPWSCLPAVSGRGSQVPVAIRRECEGPAAMRFGCNVGGGHCRCQATDSASGRDRSVLTSFASSREQGWEFQPEIPGRYVLENSAASTSCLAIDYGRLSPFSSGASRRKPSRSPGPFERLRPVLEDRIVEPWLVVGRKYIRWGNIDFNAAQARLPCGRDGSQLDDQVVAIVGQDDRKSPA